MVLIFFFFFIRLCNNKENIYVYKFKLFKFEKKIYKMIYFKVVWYYGYILGFIC